MAEEKVYRTFYDDKGNVVKKEVYEEGKHVAKDAIASATTKRSNFDEIRKKFGSAAKTVKKGIEGYNERRNRPPTMEEIQRERQKTRLLKEKYRQEVIRSKLRKSQSNDSIMAGFSGGDMFLGSGGIGDGSSSYLGDMFSSYAPEKPKKRRMRQSDDYDYSGGIQWFS